jgi:hypothetical protein
MMTQVIYAGLKGQKDRRSEEQAGSMVSSSRGDEGRLEPSPIFLKVSLAYLYFFSS